MSMLSEWPEIALLRDGRHELALKSISDDREPSINDEDLQNLAFSKDNKLNFVSISSCHLNKLHSSIANCDLQKLVLNVNSIQCLPDIFGSMCKLTVIDLSNNKLKCLPHSFSQLVKLESLIATNNELADDSLFDFSSLKNLHVLDLSFNKLTSIPASLFTEELPKLLNLDLSHNQIHSVNGNFDALPLLKVLNISSNTLKDIPASLGCLEKLKQLLLGDNPFKDSRFKKLTNDKRAKVSALIAYIVKSSLPSINSCDGKPETNTKVSPEVGLSNTTLIHVGVENASVKMLPSAKETRPHLLCCVVNDLNLVGENFRKFISIQTKLHSSKCENRTLAAIGTHEKKSFCAPLQYLALPPEELYITTLHKKTPTSGKDLIDTLVRDAELARKRTKRNTLNPLHRYLHLVHEKHSLPCLIDSNGMVISLAPVTNSDLTKISQETTSVWIEVSSQVSLAVCRDVMDALILETLSLCPNISIDQVRVYADDDNIASLYPGKDDLLEVAKNFNYIQQTNV